MGVTGDGRQTQEFKTPASRCCPTGVLRPHSPISERAIGPKKEQISSRTYRPRSVSSLLILFSAIMSGWFGWVSRRRVVRDGWVFRETAWSGENVRLAGWFFSRRVAKRGKSDGFLRDSEKGAGRKTAGLYLSKSRSGRGVGWFLPDVQIGKPS